MAVAADTAGIQENNLGILLPVESFLPLKVFFIASL
jgi:hypothetical protein